MGQVNVEIGGRSYPLSCRDGDETHLAGLARDIADKADSLTQSLGSMSEARLLLMAALMVADELYEVRKGKPPAVAETQDVAEHLEGLLLRAEQLAARIGA